MQRTNIRLSACLLIGRSRSDGDFGQLACSRQSALPQKKRPLTRMKYRRSETLKFNGLTSPGNASGDGFERTKPARQAGSRQQQLRYCLARSLFSLSVCVCHSTVAGNERTHKVLTIPSERAVRPSALQLRTYTQSAPERMLGLACAERTDCN